MTKKQIRERVRGSKSTGSKGSKVQIDRSRVPDKQATRAPGRPDAARYEHRGRTGRVKRRLGG